MGEKFMRGKPVDNPVGGPYSVFGSRFIHACALAKVSINTIV
jgi:hypothetical protein